MKEELVLEILKGEKITATLANVVTKLAISANAHAKETKARITTLWPSMQKQLQAQMAFSKNLKHGRWQNWQRVAILIVVQFSVACNRGPLEKKNFQHLSLSVAGLWATAG